MLVCSKQSKSEEVKKLKKVIDENKKEEKKVEKQIKELETAKKASKREIGNMKRKLTLSKKKTKKMEEVYDNDEVESAEDFFKKVCKEQMRLAMKILRYFVICFLFYL